MAKENKDDIRQEMRIYERKEAQDDQLQKNKLKKLSNFISACLQKKLKIASINYHCRYRRPLDPA